MSPSRSLIRSISARLQGMAAAPMAIAPWPEEPSEFDRRLSAQLHTLLKDYNTCTDHNKTSLSMTTSWLVGALDLALSLQRTALQSLRRYRDGVYSTTSADQYQSKAVIDVEVEGWVQFSVDMLDMCNEFRERLDLVEQYSSSLQIAVHAGGCHDHQDAARNRVKAKLQKCIAMERLFTDLQTTKSNSLLRTHMSTSAVENSYKPASCTTAAKKSASFSKVLPINGSSSYDHAGELMEALSASKSITMLVCSLLAIGLSFKSRSSTGLAPLSLVGRSCNSKRWSNVMQELHKAIKSEINEGCRRKGSMIACLGELRDLRRMSHDLYSNCVINRAGGAANYDDNIEGIEKKWGEMELGVKSLRNRVDEMYELIISLRMCTLDL